MEQLVEQLHTLRMPVQRCTGRETGPRRSLALQQHVLVSAIHWRAVRQLELHGWKHMAGHMYKGLMSPTTQYVQDVTLVCLYA